MMKKVPALKSSIAITLGILSGYHIESLWIFTIVLFIITCLIAFGYKQIKPSLSILILILIGFGRYHQIQKLPSHHITRHLDYNCKVTIYGHLTCDPKIKKDNTEMILRIQQIQRGETLYQVTGQARLIRYSNTNLHLKYGDCIKATGKLYAPRGQRNPGGFNYQAYLARKNIHALFKMEKSDSIIISEPNLGHPLLKYIIYPARRWIRQTLHHLLPNQNAAFLNALIIGEKSGLSEPVTYDFIQLGISHLLAVSGLHVGFVLIIFSTLFRLLRFPRLYRTILTLFILIFYLGINEIKPSVLRATTMAALYLIGQLLERRISPLNLLGCSALITLLVHPLDLFDPGFQLSYGAVLSILLLGNPIRNLMLKIYKKKKNQSRSVLNLILSGIALSISIQAGTLPIVLHHFNQINISNILLNLLAIPLTGLIVILGFIMLIAGLFNVWLASIYASLNNILISNLITGTHLVSKLAQLTLHHGPLSIFEILIYYTILCLLIFRIQRPIRNKFIILLLCLFNAWIWKNYITDASQNLIWTQLDVGQGDAAVLHLPRHHTILIDGGDSSNHWDNGEKVIAPYLKYHNIHHLDAVILTHPHQDHVGGLNYILNHFPVKQVVSGGTEYTSSSYEQFLKIVNDKNIPHQIIQTSDSLMDFPGIQCLFFWPDTNHAQLQSMNINNQSLVFKILYGKNQVLFTGDVEKAAERALIKAEYPLKSTALKTGHHGSRTASSPEFIQKVSPQWAVISVGSHNRFNLPDSSTIHQFRNQRICIKRTDIKGAILFKSQKGNALQEVQWQKR